MSSDSTALVEVTAENGADGAGSTAEHAGAASPTIPGGPGGPDETATPEKRKRGFPTAATILFSIILVMWVATFFIPSGTYATDPATGQPIPGSWHATELGLSFWDRVSLLFHAPPNGLYGIQDTTTGLISPWNVGTLFGGAQVFLFILAIGGFMTVVFSTGALDLGIAHLARRFRHSGAVLLVILCILFGVLGSVMSWSDETLGFYPILVPLVVALGYDRMVAVAVITIAPFVGVIGSTVNPFRIGVASDQAGVTMGDGIVLRLVMFVLVMAAMIVYTLRYGKRVKGDPATSITGFDAEDTTLLENEHDLELAPLTVTHKITIGLVVFTFALLTFSIIPWGAILHNVPASDYPHTTGTEPFSWELGWWLPELTVLFLVMGIVVGLVNRLGEGKIVGQFLKGMADFSGPAALVIVANALSVIMTNTQTIDTVLRSMEGMVSGSTEVVFILALSLVTLPLGFLVGSGSAGMALVMPILAPLGDFAGVGRDLVITTYASMGAWLNLWLPTNVLLVAGLALARVPFNVYIKWIWKLQVILLVIVLASLLLGLAF